MSRSIYKATANGHKGEGHYRGVFFLRISFLFLVFFFLGPNTWHAEIPRFANNPMLVSSIKF